jgi:photosystem II stability/assembly factor-like uncharacterized protein
MKKHVFLLIFSVTSILTYAQYFEPKINPNDPTLPHWVQLMYAENPNVLEVDRAYKAYFSNRPFVQDVYTRFYKRWIRYVTTFLQDDGTLHFPSTQEILDTKASIENFNAQRSGPWQFLGPKVHHRAKYAETDENVQISYHSNVYCFERCTSQPDIMYCGTESGGVFKSIDHGQNWSFVTPNLPIEGVSAVTVDPSNPNIALFSAANEVWRTTDGGGNWAITGNTAFQNLNINVWQFLFHPTNPQIVFAATNLGLYRSADNGANWTQIFNQLSMSVAFKPGDPTTVYALRYNPTTQIADFYKSTDTGLNFTIKPNGWFTVPATDAGLIESQGGRIAVTEANPNRVYVLLVGQSEAGATLDLRGTIGVYSSNNAGESWTFPHVLQGMPYVLDTHPNLMDFNGYSSDYNQIYYNTAFACSHLNENRLLIGGLNLWKSDDGGASYQAVGGYIGNLPYMHVDLQEFKNYKTSPTTEEFWFSSDGGLNLSNDWATTHVSLARGINAVNFWGIDQGWNDDILAGGRYHNGNATSHQNYPSGDFLSVGGGENATGYVNYGPERKTYFSDIDGIVVPEQQSQLVKRFSVQQFPNESYFDNNSSRMCFDWNYWNVGYLGNENVLYKSVDGGSSFSPIYTFGNDPNNSVLWIEQSHANPAIFYVQQVVNNITQLWLSTDACQTFTQVVLPQQRREVYFTLSYTNASELWIAYTSGTNGNKVYRSINGGTTWSNITTTVLNGFQPKAIAHQAGTNGGVYVAMRNGPVFYRNNASSDWSAVGSQLPAASYPLRILPFYKNNKLRLGMWNMGVWENDFQEPSALIADFSANFDAFTCPGDTLWLVNHSVCDSSATLQWTFDGATPSTSSALAPKITYAQAGTYGITLIVTQNGLSDTITKPAFISTNLSAALPIVEDFENGNLPATWKNYDDGADGDVWVVENDASGFGIGNNSIVFDNYYQDVQGKRDYFRTGKLDFSNVAAANVSYDVAYAKYDNNYSDTMAIKVSSDCGATFTTVLVKGGDQLGTAPPQTTYFTPTASQWRRDSVLITDFSGAEEVFIAFENRGRYGNPIYIDNINIRRLTTVTTAPTVSLSCRVFPNPASAFINVEITNPISAQTNYSVIDISGRIVAKGSSAQTSFTLPTANWASGLYMLEIVNGGNRLRERVVVR